MENNENAQQTVQETPAAEVAVQQAAENGTAADQTNGTGTPSADTPEAVQETSVEQVDTLLKNAQDAKSLADADLRDQITKMKNAMEVLPEDLAKDIRARAQIFEDELKSHDAAEEQKLKQEAAEAEAKVEAIKTKAKTYGIYGGGAIGWIMLAAVFYRVVIFPLL